MYRLLPALALVILCSCSDKPAAVPEPKGAAKSQPVVALAENSKHSLAKHIEVAGLRMSEKPGGKLTVTFAVVNHSQADINDLELEVTTPACTLPVKVGPLAPEQNKDVSSECKTSMRVYELPDWQFVRPTFKITAPAE